MEKYEQDAEEAEATWASPIEPTDPPSFEAVNAAMTVSPVEEPVVVAPDWAFNQPDEEIQLAIQEALFDMGLYMGKRNGAWGNLTIFAIQEVVSPLDSNGWRATIRPGVPDRELCVLVTKFASEVGDYDYDIENEVVLTDEVWLGFLNGLERKAS